MTDSKFIPLFQGRPGQGRSAPFAEYLFFPFDNKNAYFLGSRLSVSSACKDLLTLLATVPGVRKLNKLHEMHFEALEQESRYGQFWMSKEQCELLEKLTETYIGRSHSSSTNLFIWQTKAKVANVVRSWYDHEQMLSTEASKQKLKMPPQFENSPIPLQYSCPNEGVQNKVESYPNRKWKRSHTLVEQPVQSKPQRFRAGSPPNSEKQLQPVPKGFQDQQAASKFEASNKSFWKDYYAKTLRTKHARDKQGNAKNVMIGDTVLRVSNSLTKLVNPVLPVERVETIVRPPSPPLENNIDEAIFMEVSDNEDDEVVVVSDCNGSSVQEVTGRGNSSPEDDFWLTLTRKATEEENAAASNTLEGSMPRNAAEKNFTVAVVPALAPKENVLQINSSSSENFDSSPYSSNDADEPMDPKKVSGSSTPIIPDPCSVAQFSDDEVYLLRSFDKPKGYDDLAITISEKLHQGVPEQVNSPQLVPATGGVPAIVKETGNSSKSAEEENPRIRSLENVLSASSDGNFVICEVRSVSAQIIESPFLVKDETKTSEEDFSKSEFQCQHESDDDDEAPRKSYDWENTSASPPSPEKIRSMFWETFEVQKILGPASAPGDLENSLESGSEDFEPFQV